VPQTVEEKKKRRKKKEKERKGILYILEERRKFCITSQNHKQVTSSAKLRLSVCLFVCNLQ
jgi:hypothetical protein